jgi:HEAT repeat protein
MDRKLTHGASFRRQPRMLTIVLLLAVGCDFGRALAGVELRACPLQIPEMVDDEIVQNDAATWNELKEFLQALRDRDQHKRTEAANNIGRIGYRAVLGVGPVMVALRDPAFQVRAAAARALGDIGPNANRALPNLVVGANDPNEKVRMESVRAIGAIGSKSDAALGALDLALREPNAAIRASAAVSLARVGGCPNRSIDSLIEILKHDSDAWTRSCAASALGSIEPVERKAILALIAALNDPNGRVQQQAASGLMYARAREAVPFLINALRSSDHDLRRTAKDSLASIGEAAVPALVKELNSKDPKVRQNVVAALDGIVSNYMLHFGEVDEEMRKSVEPLTLALGDPDEDVRVAAQELFVHLGSIGVSALVARLRTQDELGRGSIISILTAIASEDPGAIENIIGAILGLTSSDFQFVVLVLRGGLLSQRGMQRTISFIHLISVFKASKR